MKQTTKPVEARRMATQKQLSPSLEARSPYVRLSLEEQARFALASLLVVERDLWRYAEAEVDCGEMGENEARALWQVLSHARRFLGLFDLERVALDRAPVLPENEV